MHEIILVNTEDCAIGTASKIEAHQKGFLHRAFSVLLYRRHNNQKEFLLQKRAKTKYHSAELWTNTCCSHPRPSESIKDAAARRLYEELGISGIKLENIGFFHYRAEFNNGLVENEIDHVLIGQYCDEKITLNHDEVSDIQWVEIMRLHREVQTSVNDYTAWLPQLLQLVEKSAQL